MRRTKTKVRREEIMEGSSRTFSTANSSIKWKRN
jgi:hypothetical protein